MGVIPTELIKIKDLDGSIGTMKNASSDIQGKLSTLSTATTKAKDEIDSNYDSSNKASLLNNFTSLNDALTKIKSSLSSDLDEILNLIETLITQVKELETINTEIAEQESIISTAMSNLEDATAVSTISAAESKKRELEEKFTRLCNDAMANLNTLKSMNPTIEIALASASSASFGSIGKVSEQLSGLEEGTYKRVDYKAENGRVIRTYIYLPEGAKSIDGLGVSLYMGSDGAIGHALQDGVGRQMRLGTQYSGIVVALQPENEKSFSDPTYLDAAKELTDNIIKTFNADADKISISGYSYGGSGAQHMIERNPGYFAQGVILGQGTGAIGRESGGDKKKGIEKIKQTKMHLICGTADGGNYADLQGLYEKLSDGGEATYEWRKGVDHDHINDQGSIVVNGVEYPNYVEFCLAQSRNAVVS